MMAENEKASLKVTTPVGSLSMEGVSTDKLAAALGDFISPVTQGMGFIGDAVRVYRQENAIRAIGRAKHLAQKHQVELRPVPPKFLVDWVERVSLEESDDIHLQEAWSGLLLSAAQKISPAHYLFKRAISEFTHEHIDFISHLTGGQTDFSETLSKFDDFPYCFRIQSLEIHSLSLGSNVREQVFEWAKDAVTVGCIPASLVLSATSGAILERENVVFSVSSTVCDQAEQNGVIPSLLSYGFLSYFDAEFEVHDDLFFARYETKYPGSKKRGYLEVKVLYLTPIGRRFVMACNGVLLDD